MRKSKRYLLLGVIFFMLVILPILSYLVIRQGYIVRKNAAASTHIFQSDTGLPIQNYISQRGDTLTPDRLKGKVVLVEFIDRNSYQLTKERHPLFEIQEAYNGKTLSLRMLSIWADSSRPAENADLSMFGSRFAVREFWHVSTCPDTEVIYQTIGAAFSMEEEEVKSKEKFFPHTVYVLNKQGTWCGVYELDSKEEFDALYNDILFLIDQ